MYSAHSHSAIIFHVIFQAYVCPYVPSSRVSKVCLKFTHRRRTKTIEAGEVTTLLEIISLRNTFVRRDPPGWCGAPWFGAGFAFAPFGHRLQETAAALFCARTPAHDLAAAAPRAPRSRRGRSRRRSRHRDSPRGSRLLLQQAGGGPWSGSWPESQCQGPWRGSGFSCSRPARRPMAVSQTTPARREASATP